ncbi:MAG: hypothetical protein E7288_03085 [Lachnospiraceae bacterium]|nr:hypothetical protein [Lachnospiraceae bacterium]
MKKNVKNALLTLVIGGGVALLLTVFPKGGAVQGDRILRNEYGKGPLEIEMEVSGEQFQTQMTYHLEERRYTAQEIEEMLPSFIEELERNVIGEENEDGKVKGELHFVQQLQGYPFTVSYETDRPDLIGKEGERLGESKEGTVVEIAASILYEEFRYLHIFYVELLPEEKNLKELWKKRLEEYLTYQEEAQREEAYVYLPQELEGERLRWKVKKSSKAGIVLLLSIVVSAVMFSSEYIQKKEDSKKRTEALQDAYPAFALRYSMLVSAGLTLRQALLKIAQGADAQKPLYQEIIRGVHELEAGISEGNVYENIGRRCNTPQMRKFGTLLASNLRKGQEGLSALLREEASIAMAQRREIIRKKGETAGTKLLFPMLLLLLIVFVVIMVPAFSSFTF